MSRIIKKIHCIDSPSLMLYRWHFLLVLRMHMYIYIYFIAFIVLEERLAAYLKGTVAHRWPASFRCALCKDLREDQVGLRMSAVRVPAPKQWATSEKQLRCVSKDSNTTTLLKFILVLPQQERSKARSWSTLSGVTDQFASFKYSKRNLLLHVP